MISFLILIIFVSSQISLRNLQNAVEEGDVRTLKNELDKKEKSKVKDENGSNLLHLAVLHGNTGILTMESVKS